MADVRLYFFPMTCARVTMVALEQAGVAYDVEIIDIMKRGQKAPEYLAINPAGKLPALRIGKAVLTETIAILLYLHELHPQANLLPPADDPIARARLRADLLWVATTLHPLVRQLRAPMHYTIGDVAPVRANALEEFKQELGTLDARLAKASWWYGEEWAVIDAYLGWILSGFTSVGNDLSVFPALAAYVVRLKSHPAYARMYEHEGRLMQSHGLTLPPGVIR
jgi:glutathione S-transferase